MGRGPSRERWKEIGLGVGIVLLVFGVYGAVWKAGFIWDDDGLAVGNPAVRSAGGLGAIWAGLGQKAYYPMTTSLWWLEYRLWGEHAAGWHLVNVALHAINAVLVWRVLKRLGVPGAWGAGVIFGVHPVCVESVAWVSETKNTLSLMFALGTIWAMMRREETGWAGWYWAGLGLYGASLLSKSTVATLPAIWLVVLWWKTGRLGWGDLWRGAPMFAMAGVLGLVAVWFEWGGVLRGEGVRGDGVLGRVLGAAWGVWFYAGKVVWPAGLTMIYPRREFRAGEIWGWVAAVALAVAAGVLWWRRDTAWGRAGAAAGACFVLGVLPVVGLVDISYFRYSLVADHFQYVGMIALIAAGVAMGWRVLGEVRGRWVWGVVVVGLAVLSWRRVGVYADARTLWGDVVAKNPGAWAGWVNLGNAWAKEGKMAEAEGAYRRALEVRPGEPVASYDLGMMLARRGEWRNALAYLEHGREVAATVADGSYILGHVLREVGQGDRAVEWYRRAVELKTDHADARAELGMELIKQGHVAEGAGEFESVLRVKGEWVDVMNNLAWIRATSTDARVRNGPEAVRLAERACELMKYKNAAQLDTLAAAYAECGRFGEAVATAKQAVERTMAESDREAIRRRMAEYQQGRTVRE